MYFEACCFFPAHTNELIVSSKCSWNLFVRLSAAEALILSPENNHRSPERQKWSHNFSICCWFRSFFKRSKVQGCKVRHAGCGNGSRQNYIMPSHRQTRAKADVPRFTYFTITIGVVHLAVHYICTFSRPPASMLSPRLHNKDGWAF